MIKLGFWSWRHDRIISARAAIRVLRFRRSISEATPATREIASRGRMLGRFFSHHPSRRAAGFYFARSLRKLLFGR